MKKTGRKTTTASEKNVHSERIDFRLSPFHKKRILWLAKTYAGGNLSKWLTHAALNADRKFLVAPAK